MGFSDYFSRSAFVRSDTDDGHERLAHSLIHPKGVLSGLGLCRPVKLFHTKRAHPCLCAPVHGHVGALSHP